MARFRQGTEFQTLPVVDFDPTVFPGVSGGTPNLLLLRTDTNQLYYYRGPLDTNWILLGNATIFQTTSTRLILDTSSTAVPPVYSTLFTGTITKSTSSSSRLLINFGAAARHTGAGVGNVAINFRFRLNAVLITPGGGVTSNMTKDRIEPFNYSVVLPIALGLNTVNVEWAGFGLGANTMLISPVTLPDLNFAQLILQELL